MKSLIVTAALLLASCGSGQSGILGSATQGQENYNTLIQNGSFAPATTLSTPVAQYQSYKYGWLIGFGMNTFNGHWADQITQVPPAPSAFNVTSVNVQKWADTAAVHNVQYAALTVLNEYGFLLYPSEVQYNMPQLTIGSGLSPYYTSPYCVQPGVADTAIVTKFVNAFAAKGIEPVFYVGFGANTNIVRVTGGQMWGAGNPVERQELCVQYYCKVVQEMALKFPRVKYYWIDMASTIPAGYAQRLYDALKSINRGITIIGNAAGETNFGRFPYDIQSTEEYVAYNNPSIISSNSRTYGGTTYYVGQELVGTPYSDYSQWYYYDDSVPDQPFRNPFTGAPPYVKMQLVSASTFQGLVNNGKTYSRPFMAAVLVDRNGDLVQSNLNFLRGINFY